VKDKLLDELFLICYSTCQNNARERQISYFESRLQSKHGKSIADIKADLQSTYEIPLRSYGFSFQVKHLRFYRKCKESWSSTQGISKEIMYLKQIFKVLGSGSIALEIMD